eukprot:COSAG01_NODE_53_length_31352_cov_23.122452_25_plen_257_part_00
MQVTAMTGTPCVFCFVLRMRSSDDALTPPQRHPDFDAVSAVTCLLGEYDRSRLWLAGWLAGSRALAATLHAGGAGHEAASSRRRRRRRRRGWRGGARSLRRADARGHVCLPRPGDHFLVPGGVALFTHRYQGENGRSAPRIDCPPGTLRTQPCQPHTRSGTAGGVRCACRLPVCLTARACACVACVARCGGVGRAGGARRVCLAAAAGRQGVPIDTPHLRAVRCMAAHRSRAGCCWRARRDWPPPCVDIPWERGTP